MTGLGSPDAQERFRHVPPPPPSKSDLEEAREIACELRVEPPQYEETGGSLDIEDAADRIAAALARVRRETEARVCSQVCP